MRRYLAVFVLLFCFSFGGNAQTIADDFEGNGTIDAWVGDDCELNVDAANPFQQGINTSARVLIYNDNGGQYANVRFEAANTFNLLVNHTFSVKIYVPATGLTGNQPNQISLKLQDGTLNEPWSTQSEIIKPLALNEWQTISFNFASDAYINLDGNSLPPTQRTDFNRVVIQLNGENNNDYVLAYIDDFYYDGTIPVDPVFDNLIWSDEFNENGAIDNTKWFHQTELPIDGSWYNGEVQHYTNRTDNAVVQNGILSIVAKRENFTDQGYTKQFTSARLNSKFAFTYGRVEVRAKLPAGLGTWPAIWMLGKNINENGAYWDNQGLGTTPWPACGEIDIMEHWGYNQNYVQSAIHTPSSFGGTVNVGGQFIPTASTGFHVYTMDWSAEKMVFSVDGVVHYTYNPPVKDASTWPFDAEQYILLNFAIQPEIYPGFTQDAMEIDYVRVYQESAVATLEVKGDPTPVYYPNPVTDELTIVLEAPTEQMLTINIYTSDGKLIRSNSVAVSQNQVTLKDLGILSPGMYIVSYEVNHHNYSFKVFKQ